MGRRILGNLDAEGELARRAAAGPGTGRRRRHRQTLTRSALAAASALATLLRVFAREGDRLWTPTPVDPERLPEVPGLPRPVLESGPWADLAAAEALLAWAETPAVAAARGARTASPPVPALGSGGPLHELLWRLPPTSPAVVARVHHRGFALETARRLGLALPGACLVETAEELGAHLEAGGAAASPTGGWVVKAPLSAAGRDRYIHPGPKVPDTSSSPQNVPDTRSALGASNVPDTFSPAVRRRLEGLFMRHGPLLFEPWMERIEDFGLAAVLDAEDLRVVGFHRLLVDPRGGFTGVELGARFAGLEEVLRGAPKEDRELWRRSVEGVAAALAEAGYTGPFGIDGYRHRTAGGTSRLHPLGEINARMTFGLVARCLAGRVGEALGWPAATRVRLTVGRQAPGGQALMLLVPGEDGSPGAWLAVNRTSERGFSEGLPPGV